MAALVIHVFMGTESHVQRDCFYGALNELGISECEVMTFAQLKNNIRCKNWTLDTFLSWLQECDIYIIFCHIHQDFGVPPLLWEPVDFYDQLYDKLHGRLGFPSGDQLRCPIFTQNKFRYIEALGSLCNPTFVVPIEVDMDYNSYVSEFDEFIVAHNEGGGMVVKAPFITNGKHYLSIGLSTSTQIVKAIESVIEEFGNLGCYSVPYLMIQPCMINRKEKKIVCVGGQYCYTLHPQCSSGYEYRYEGNVEARYAEFAEHAIYTLKKNLPECVLDGLVRVDIFETSNNDDNGDPVWAVNEMESFEAIFEGSNAARRAQTHSKITQYWKAVISGLIRQARHL